MRNQEQFSVEQLESRRLLSIVNVLSGREYHFTDSHGTDQHVSVSGGTARVTLSDLVDGSHEIQSVQLISRFFAQVSFDASTDVPRLFGQRVGAVHVAGNLGSFSALTVSGGVDVGGNLDQFRALLATGSVHVVGSLGTLVVGSFRNGSLSVEHDVLGTVQVLRGLDTISVGFQTDPISGASVATAGQLVGAIRVGGDLDHLELSGSAATARVTIGGDLGELDVAGSLGGTVRVFGEVGQGNVAGDLVGRITAGSIETFQVGGDMPITSTLVAGDVSGSLTFASDVAGRISLGALSSSVVVSGTLYGSIRVLGDANTIALGYTVNPETSELESTGAPLFGSIFVGGDLTSLKLGGGSGDTASVRVVGNLESLVSEADVAGRIAVGGNLTEFDAFGQMLAQLTVGGNLDSFIAVMGQSAESTIFVAGNIGGMEFGGDVAGSITAAHIDSVLIQGCLIGTIEGADPEDIIALCGGGE